MLIYFYSHRFSKKIPVYGIKSTSITNIYNSNQRRKKERLVTVDKDSLLILIKLNKNYLQIW